jgi:DNA (cytosine-5)-methyltransferase 1
MACLEICAGAGGQALGACETFRLNRQHAWKVIEADVCHFGGRPYNGLGLLAGGVPCPPFTVADKQLGADDKRDLFPEALRLVRECEPPAVMLENFPGLVQSKFAATGGQVLAE